MDEDSKSSSEEIDRSSEHNNDEMGTGRSYECVFCRRGFTTAQALGGHMNIHRKDRATKAKPNFPPSSSCSTKVDESYNYADLGLYSASNPRGNYYSSLPDPEVDTNYNYYHQLYFPSHSCGPRSSPPSRVQYGEVLCVENQRDPQLLFGQDWRQRGLSLYTNPLCAHENKDKIVNNSEEDDLDLELRLGHHP